MAEENPHAQAGYQAGKVKADEQRDQPSVVWSKEVLMRKAVDAANAYRWQFSERTDLPLSGPDWNAYCDSFVRGYMETHPKLSQ